MDGSHISLERVHYHLGQLLTTSDLIAEQEYFLERLRRHNRYCHGWGIVCGLDLSINGTQVSIAPGMALDCYGNEIFIPIATTLPLPTDQTIRALYAVLHYAESLTDPVPIAGGPCRNETENQQFSRIAETFELKFSNQNTALGHVQHKGRCQPCGTAHGVSLGRLRWYRSRWRIDPWYRPCQVFE